MGHLRGVASGNTGGSASVSSVIADDTTTNATVYPTWVAGTGTQALKISTTKVSFNPSTGVLSSTSFTGAGTGLTGTAAALSIGGNAATATTATNVVGGTITPSQTIGIVGTTTNNSVNSGSVGEYVESIVAIGSAASITSGVTKTITSISLTAGDWDVWAICGTSGNAATLFQYIIGAISTTDNGISDANRGVTVNSYGATGVALIAASAPATPVSPVRISIAGTTTIYLTTNVSFSVNSATAYGSMYARRVR